ncbi:phage tail sheath family protein [Kitasatospora mediocidica]|uniref:phage tail sheath family protein n=1 Tax=Kitasatospora mediocidica TaxID=58352 RepID=UPI00055DBEE7|nr:phage tail sheath C-terminal domain-containing protein [Kitasatospora mediocidica]
MATKVVGPSAHVYVEETFTIGLSVRSGPTSVTAFVGDFPGVPAAGARVGSWLDFTALAGEDGDGDLRKALGPVLKSYFHNGGGHCYLVSTAESSLAEALRAVSALGDVTLLAAPGLWDQGAQAAREWARALTGWAAANKAMTILHTDRDHTPEQATKAVEAWDLDGETRGYAAVYFPWLRQSGDEEPLVPVGAVAGAWAAVDRERGVWKAPANIALRGTDGPICKATDDDQGARPNLNFLRTFPGTGDSTLIWGARTLSDLDSWRYIPVRRLFNAVERDIERALSAAMFEPNSQPTWEMVRASVDTYLHGLWQQGALQGHSAQEAYFVQVGTGVTMTEDDIAAGRLIVKAGLAAVRPAEFIILQFTQEMSQL